MRTRVLTAFFRRQVDAENARTRLLGMGVTGDAISLLPKAVTQRDDLGITVRTRAPEGTAIGGLAFGVTGAVAGALGAGASVVAPVIGLVMAGPMIAACALGGAFGAIGMIVGGIVGAAIRTCEARYMDDALTRGGALIAVRCLGDGWPSVITALARSGGVRVRLAR